MQPNVEQALWVGMEEQRARLAPPTDFPALPVIPAARYTDPAFLALEQEYLWQRSWLYALHQDELPKPGSFRLFRKTGSPIVLTRGNDNKIRAFYNACRHRGAPLGAPLEIFAASRFRFEGSIRCPHCSIDRRWRLA